MQLSAILWICGYAIACLLIGVFAARRIQSPDDWFVAGRRLGPFVLGASVFATTVTGFAFIGGPALILRFGTSSLWILITGPLGAGLVFWLLAKPLSRLSKERGLWSLPGLLESHYQSRLLGALATIALTIGIVLYLGVQVLAFIAVMRGLNLFGDAIWPIALGGLLFAGYAVRGGTLASVWTDALQGVLMATAAVFVLFAVFGRFESGPSLFQTLATVDPEGSGLFGSHGASFVLGWYLVFTLGNAGQPHVLRTLFCARSDSALRRALPFVIAGGTLGALLWAAIGLCMRALVLNGQEPCPDHFDDATLHFLQTSVSPWLSGLIVTGLLAAIMSSADTLLNQGAIAVVHDAPRALRLPPLEHPIRAARIASLLLLLLSIGLALLWGDLLAFLGVMAWGLFAAIFVPCLALGLHWRLAHSAGAIASILLSLTLSFGFRFGLIAAPAGVLSDAMVLLLSITTFVVVSMLAQWRAGSLNRPSDPR